MSEDLPEMTVTEARRADFVDGMLSGASSALMSFAGLDEAEAIVEAHAMVQAFLDDPAAILSIDLLLESGSQTCLKVRPDGFEGTA